MNLQQSTNKMKNQHGVISCWNIPWWNLQRWTCRGEIHLKPYKLFNSIYEKIKFTKETEANNQLSLLDLHINKIADNYQKKSTGS